jgi:hypothetical protein
VSEMLTPSAMRSVGGVIVLISTYMILTGTRSGTIRWFRPIDRSENPARFWFWILVLVCWLGSGLEMVLTGRFWN